MQGVELVEGHHVEDLLHLRGVEEVSRDVEHQPAVGEARGVVDLHAGDDPLCGALTSAYGRGQQLPQGLDGVEEPGQRRGADGDAAARDVEQVAFRGEALVDHEAESLRGGGIGGIADGVLALRGFGEACGECLEGGARGVVHPFVADECGPRGGECSRTGCQVVGVGNQVVPVFPGAGGQQQARGDQGKDSVHVSRFGLVSGPGAAVQPFGALTYKDTKFPGFRCRREAKRAAGSEKILPAGRNSAFWDDVLKENRARYLPKHKILT